MGYLQGIVVLESSCAQIFEMPRKRAHSLSAPTTKRRGRPRRRMCHCDCRRQSAGPAQAAGVLKGAAERPLLSCIGAGFLFHRATEAAPCQMKVTEASTGKHASGGPTGPLVASMLAIREGRSSQSLAASARSVGYARPGQFSARQPRRGLRQTAPV